LIELVEYFKMESEERKICTKSLEKVLYHLSGLKKSEANWTKGIDTIKDEYKKHIPECLDCKITYVDFLNSIKGKNQSLREVDKKYFGVLKDNPTNHHT